MEESIFKDFIKRLNKLPLLYKESHQQPNAPIPFLSLPLTTNPMNTVNIPTEQQREEEITVKVLNGQVLSVPKRGSISALKQKVSATGAVRIILQGKALGDDIELSTLPEGATLQAVISDTSPTLNREALKRDVSAVLLRHGVSPVHIDALVTNLLNQL